MTPAPDIVPPDSAVQIWTLIVAAFAALAALASAAIAALSASRRERTAWLRQEQTLGYEAFSSAAWAGFDVIAAGAVETALQRPDFAGLDESRSEVALHTGRIFDAARRVAVIGGTDVVKETWRYAVDWSQRSEPAIPLAGATHEAALAQRSLYLEHFTKQLLIVATTMRYDLGLLSRKERKTLDRLRAEMTDLPPLHFDDVETGDANEALKRWRVRTWSGAEIGPDYRAVDTPWAQLKVSHEAMFQPLVAVLRKLQNGPWLLAIDPALTPTQVDLIERDVATVVIHFSSAKPRFGGKTWYTGELPGERLFFWTEEDFATARSI